MAEAVDVGMVRKRESAGLALYLRGKEEQERVYGHSVGHSITPGKEFESIGKRRHV